MNSPNSTVGVASPLPNMTFAGSPKWFDYSLTKRAVVFFMERPSLGLFKRRLYVSDVEAAAPDNEDTMQHLVHICSAF